MRYAQAFNMAQAHAITATGNSSITPVARNKPPISVGSASTAKITAIAFANPQETLNARQRAL